MPRKKYKFTESDLPIAWEYIRKKLHLSLDWPKVGKNHKAKEEFFNSNISEKDLDNWCNNWLSENKLHQLKNAIWSQRKRDRDRNKKKSNQRLSENSIEILKQAAKEKNVSINQLIQKTFGGDQ